MHYAYESILDKAKFDACAPDSVLAVITISAHHDSLYSVPCLVIAVKVHANGWVAYSGRINTNIAEVRLSGDKLYWRDAVRIFNATSEVAKLYRS